MDIRTDRFDVAIDANDKIYAQKMAKRQEKIDARKPKPATEEGAEGAETKA